MTATFSAGFRSRAALVDLSGFGQMLTDRSVCHSTGAQRYLIAARGAEYVGRLSCLSSPTAAELAIFSMAAQPCASLAWRDLCTYSDPVPLCNCSSTTEPLLSLPRKWLGTVGTLKIVTPEVFRKWQVCRWCSCSGPWECLRLFSAPEKLWAGP